MKTLINFLFLVIIGTGSTLAAEVKDIKDFSLQHYQGKVIYLDFWASWCKPCVKSFPWMNQLSEKYASRNFEVVTINLDTKAEAMELFLEKIPANFSVYHDPQGNMAEKFDLPGMPTSFIIDRDGKAVKKHVGFFKNKITALENEIESLL